MAEIVLCLLCLGVGFLIGFFVRGYYVGREISQLVSVIQEVNEATEAELSVMGN